VRIVEFTGHLLSDRDTTSSTGTGAGVNGNNQWEWEGNGNKTRLNMGLGMGMGMNHWEWEGMRLKKIFQLISICRDDEQTRAVSRVGLTLLVLTLLVGLQKEEIAMTSSTTGSR